MATSPTQRKKRRRNVEGLLDLGAAQADNQTVRASRPTAPARVKVVGGILAVFGAITILGVTLDPMDMTKAEVTWNYAGSAFAIAIGFGLFFSQRWAWVLAVIVAMGAVVLGVYYGVADGGDITSPGLDIAILILLVVPGLVLTALLLSGASLHWYRRRGEDATTPVPDVARP
jgi:hypothetical protein